MFSAKIKRKQEDSSVLKEFGSRNSLDYEKAILLRYPKEAPFSKWMMVTLLKEPKEAPF